MADDDILYKPDCLETYTKAILNGKIHHIGFCQVDPIVRPREIWEQKGYIKINYNGQEVMKHKGRGVGCWLSFTKELIDKIGYFKVMRGKYGFEHINFTYRCIEFKMIPHPMDIVEPLRYMDHISFEPVGINKFNKSHSISEEYRRAECDKNKKDWKIGLDKYISLVE